MWGLTRTDVGVKRVSEVRMCIMACMRRDTMI